MKVYKLDTDGDHYASLNALNLESSGLVLDIANNKDGPARHPKFSQIDWFIQTRKTGRYGANIYEVGDFIGSLSSFCFGATVHESPLLTILKATGNVDKIDLPHDEVYNHKKVWMYYPTKVENCLDREKSNIIYFPTDPDGSQRIIMINGYGLFEERLKKIEPQIFRLVDIPTNPPLLKVDDSNPFTQFYFIYHQYGFTGLKFTEVWRSEGEADYDLEATVERMRYTDEIEHPLYTPHA